MTDLLTPHQRAVAGRVLDEEEARRRHLVVALSGAHAYGFASPDSDLDLKAIHVAPTRALLGFSPDPGEASRMEVIEGVEIDYTSNELGGVLRGVLKGNGNYIERILGPIALREAPELAPLRPLVAAALCRRVHHHYRGFAASQQKAWEEGGGRSAKKALYVLRTALTGVHALLAGRIVTDVTQLLDEHGFGEARELIAIKQAGERAALPPALTDAWRERLGRAFTLLDDAHARSALPAEPPNAAALEAFLLDLRRQTF